MERMERMDYLIGRLLAEGDSRRPHRLPADEAGRWRLLRSLMNMRRPGPVDDDFLREQNALLRELTAQKGVVEANALPHLPGEPGLVLWQGDITRLRVGAIVNAANPGLLGCFQPCHSCIDNAIHSYAGVQLRNECAALLRRDGIAVEPTGSARLTGGHNLPAAHVLHTVGPVVAGRQATPADDRLLASCYRACLRLAAAHGIESVAFCCISTGVYRFPGERAARIAIHTVRDHLASRTTNLKVIFNVYTQEDRTLYAGLLGAD